MPDSPRPVTPDPLAAKLAEIRDGERAAPRSAMRHLLAAVDAVLELHPQTAYTAYTEPCTRHLGDILGQRECTSCWKVERAGCERCRDENGHPATPEDCRERQAISRALLGEEAGDGG